MSPHRRLILKIDESFGNSYLRLCCSLVLVGIISLPAEPIINRFTVKNG
jgi:hypothetical protein